MSSNDLIERLERAANNLDALASFAQTHWCDEGDAIRLKGKAEGVRLALSYVQEMVRSELA